MTTSTPTPTPTPTSRTQTTSTPQDQKARTADLDAETLWRQDRDHFIHPFTDFSQFHDKGCEMITDSDGIYVEDVHGNRFIDGIAGLWCVNVGHGRREIAQAMADQASRMAYFSTFNNLSNAPASQLAAKLAELAPAHLNHVFYTCGGSTANDATIRLVHYYFNRLGKPNKKRILSRRNAYHGTTYLAASLTGIESNNWSFDTLSELVTHLSEANLYRRPEGMSESEYCDHLVNELEAHIAKIGADNIAAFIAEPIMGAGGVLMAPRGYHKRIQAVCRANDILYIADEVVTGFGRLGHFFASEAVFETQPDIINIAKGLSSGYSPLGASLISDELYAVLGTPQCKGGVLSTGFTYSGHPVSCAAALKNIEIMEREDICANVREVGPYLEQSLKSLSHHTTVGDVRGSNFMMCLENVADKATGELLPVEARVGDRVAEEAQKRGLIIRPVGHLNVISPTLIWSRETVDTAVTILDEALSATTASLKRDGFI
ncbi:aspartate aminotransferase family protein [Halomonas cupida]|uniref:Adenosylmethionine-8-amino-7-oxononanoate aminotransferase n=1 Tax=Halomonas cupida TaxID=44933 RepID=A0A1M7J266_9GAMM|nr:aminotransferase [Halomonas cupida]GEN24283.1 aspartate aminotransferase family protein [Halomonas cupida]SHM47003.1 Adenosylmethionine-8-amino-7-oxononanoate aminotransferase [Halomonas cupida]